MYLVCFPTEGEGPYLFFRTDPRTQGCPYPVIEGVELQDIEPTTDEWTSDDSEQFVLARSRQAPKTYRVFRSELDVPMNFDILPNAAAVLVTWKGVIHGRIRQGGQLSARRNARGEADRDQLLPPMLL